MDSLKNINTGQQIIGGNGNTISVTPSTNLPDPDLAEKEDHFKNKIRSYIRNGEIENALQALLEYCKEKSFQIFINEVLVKEAEFNLLSKQFRMNIISRDVHKTNLNSILNSILELSDKIVSYKTV